MLTKKDKDIIQEFLEETKKEVIKNHINYGQKASGKFIAGLEVEMNADGGQLIDGAGYSYFLEYGRGPTSQGAGGGESLVDILKDWFRVKGLTITKQFNPYSVAKTIHTRGNKLYRQLGQTGSGSGVITGAINDSALKNFFEKYATVYHTNAYSEVTKELTL